MKLSEAILLSIGAVKNDTRIFFSPFSEDGTTPCPRGCAIGTALYSVGYHEFYTGYINIVGQIWPWAKGRIAEEISMRHSLGESRESIAAWIATIEPTADIPVITKESQALAEVA